MAGSLAEEGGAVFGREGRLSALWGGSVVGGESSAAGAAGLGGLSAELEALSRPRSRIGHGNPLAWGKGEHGFDVKYSPDTGTP